MEHNYCIAPRVSPQRIFQVNGSIPKLNVPTGHQTCIVSPTVSKVQTPQVNVVPVNNPTGK